MTVVETVLVYVGIPAAILTAVSLVILAPSLARQPNRYRPGKEWTHEPQWFIPHEAHPHAETNSGAPSTVAVGGASGEW